MAASSISYRYLIAGPQRWIGYGAVLGMLSIGWPSVTNARPTGEDQDCANCHYQTDGPELGLLLSSEAPELGQSIDVTVEIDAIDGEALRTGLWLSTAGQGQFVLVEPDSTRFTEEGGEWSVVHSEPRVLDAQGQAQFQLQWIAPAEPGVTEFTLWSMTGNSNGDSSDDHHAVLRRSIAHGCEATTYYPDADGDGFGDDLLAVLSCEVIEGMIEQGGDCDDGDALINPQREEICNFIDDDCDGVRDNGLEPDLYYPDLDGDGFGVESDTPEFTCNNVEGFTAEVGDCDPLDAAIYPGAPEVQNGRDDDCDGEIDEVDSAGDDDVDPDAPGPEPDPELGDTAGATEDEGGGCRVGEAGDGSPLSPWGWLLFLPWAWRRVRIRHRP